MKKFSSVCEERRGAEMGRGLQSQLQGASQIFRKRTLVLDAFLIFKCLGRGKGAEMGRN